MMNGLCSFNRPETPRSGTDVDDVRFLAEHNDSTVTDSYFQCLSDDAETRDVAHQMSRISRIFSCAHSLGSRHIPQHFVGFIYPGSAFQTQLSEAIEFQRFRIDGHRYGQAIGSAAAGHEVFLLAHVLIMLDSTDVQ